MKITALEINNIASIDGCYEIDFEKEPLSSVGLFAITGATGAGKSTILDAICLALYNKTPRLAPLTSTIQIVDIKDKTISNKDVKTLLRKGAIQGHVKVTFIGVDEKYYRSEWSIRRANNRISGTIQSEEIILYQVSDNIVFPEKRKTMVLNEIERLIGLKYEQFTKSVILAQGEFTSFLKADDNNRADILEKLTGTDIYSKISRKVFDKYRIQKAEIEKLNTKLEMFQLLSDKEIETLTNDIEILNLQVNEFKIQLSNSIDIENWYKKEKNLLEEINKISIELNQRKEQLNINKNRIDHFNIIEKFQEIKDVVISFQKKNQESEHQNLALKNTNQKIEIQKDQINNLNNDLNSYKTQFQEIQKQINHNLPFYNEARKLDFQIEVEQKKYSEKENIFSDLKAKSKETNEVLQQKIQFINDLNLKQNQINSWFEQNRIYELFVLNENWILARLKEAEELKNKIPSYEQKHQNLDLESKNLQPIFEVKETEKEHLETKELEILTKLKDLNFILEAQNLTELEKNRKALHVNRELKISQLEIFKLLIEQKNIISDSQKKLFDFNNKKKQLNVELIETENLLKESKIQKETLQVFLDKLRLEKSANVVSLRENLVENEACPVCGSLNHPFVMHNPLEKITDETANDFNELELKIQSLNNKEVTLKQQLIQILENISYINEIENKAKLNVEKLEPQTLEIFFEANNLDETEKYNVIENELKTIQSDIQIIETKLDVLRKQWFDKEQLQAEMAHLQQNIKKVSQELFEIKSKITDVNHNKQLVFEGIEQNKLALNRQISEVSNILATNQWFDLWQQNPTEFVLVHSKIAQDWRNYQSNSDKISEQNIQIKTEIQQLENLVLMNSKDFEKAKHDVDEIKEQLEKYKTIRNGYFNGQSVDLIEKNLNDDFANIKEKIESKNQLIIELNNQLIALESNKNAIDENLKSIEFILNENKFNIENWAKKMNISLEKVIEFSNFNSEWIQNERTFIQNIHTQINKQEALFEDKNKVLENHINTNKPIISEIEIIQQIKDFEEKIKLTDEKSLTNKHRLEIDSENRKAQSDLIEKRDNIFKIASKWNQLNELIGSADGAKFKKIAQEYTLDILLRYANIHLIKINRRYTLQRIPNTLSLQVMDNDMACEIRSVHSLSGGESFLVSLALALALSSLSSSKMNIQSLFIDEGFGTLDAQTLAIAMDALESLQNQGKKVGVISHVSEMTERIPVQIHVEKLGNGRSKIEIMGI